jgi:hypothetical protein
VRRRPGKPSHLGAIAGEGRQTSEQRRNVGGFTIKTLFGMLLFFASVILGFTLVYWSAFWVLRLVSRLPMIGKVVSVESSKGIDTFKLSLGGLFCWRVAVNSRKGTIAGSIQIDSEKRWGPLAFFAAIAGAFVIPGISSVLMPAALIAVAVGLARGRLGARSTTPGARVSRGVRARVRGSAAVGEEST